MENGTWLGKTALFLGLSTGTVSAMSCSSAGNTGSLQNGQGAPETTNVTMDLSLAPSNHCRRASGDGGDDSLTSLNAAKKCCPMTAAQACGNSNCGSVPDGCGGTILCGTCTAPQACTGNPGICTCVPLSESQACANAPQCGTTAPDGCGGTINCGFCGEFSICVNFQCVPHCPTTVAQACGANNCGTAPDGCGGIYDCGTCTAPALCSIPDGGTAGVCM